LILQDIVTTDQTALEKGEYGRDYLIERENGTVLLRIRRLNYANFRMISLDTSLPSELNTRRKDFC
jgi:hypothetical protein